MSTHHDPLSPEERALADRLARLGPHDGPPPALDARILAAAHAAAAHAAAARPRRRRWLAMTAIPGGLITGAGMAAALVLVVGVVWQLRPSSPTTRLPREEGDMGVVSVDLIKREARKTAVAPPPPPPETVASTRALQTPAPAQARKATPAEPAPVSDEHEHYVDEAISHTPPRASAAETGAAAVYSAPAPPPPPAAIAAAETAREEQVQRQVAAQTAADSSARERGDATAAASAKRAAMAASPAAEAAPASTTDAAAASHAPADVTADAALEPAQWLQRIRERRDAGDLDSARESLRHFREAHPRVRLPRDLRELAAPSR